MSMPAWLANPAATVEFHSVRPELLPAIRAGARKGRGTVKATAEYRGATTKTVIVSFAGDGLQDRRSAFLDSLSPLRIVPDILNPNFKSLQPSTPEPEDTFMGNEMERDAVMSGWGEAWANTPPLHAPTEETENDRAWATYAAIRKNAAKGS